MSCARMFVFLMTIVLLASLAPAEDHAETSNSTEIVRQWLALSAYPLAGVSESRVDDLEPLTAALSQARVIGFGETAHQTHEIQLFRLRALRALVHTQKVRVLAMEAGFAETSAVDPWVRGLADAEPDFTVVFPFNGEGTLPELREALRWLRSYNATVPLSARVGFVGLDLPLGGGALRPALDLVWRYLDRVDPEFSQRSRSAMQPALARFGEGWPATAKPRFDALDPSAQTSLTSGIEELERQFETKRATYTHGSGSIDAAEFDRVQHAVTVAAQTLAFIKDPGSSSNPRDQALAANVQWTLKQLAGDEKIVIWSHNAHVQKEAIDFEGMKTPAQSMGEILAGKLGNAYAAIGTTVGQIQNQKEQTGAARAPSIDDVLATLGRPSFFVNLRDTPREGAVAKWLSTPHTMRFQESYIHITPVKAFDGIVFFDHVSMSVHVADSAK